jgi:hypothetical protein
MQRDQGAEISKESTSLNDTKPAVVPTKSSPSLEAETFQLLEPSPL